MTLLYSGSSRLRPSLSTTLGACRGKCLPRRAGWGWCGGGRGHGKQKGPRYPFHVVLHTSRTPPNPTPPPCHPFSSLAARAASKRISARFELREQTPCSQAEQAEQAPGPVGSLPHPVTQHPSAAFPTLSPARPGAASCSAQTLDITPQPTPPHDLQSRDEFHARYHTPPRPTAHAASKLAG